MKCPNCGKEMKEGYLICEHCGNEIRIVPDFEPEIENSITETLSTLAALQEDAKTEETGQETQEVEEERKADFIETDSETEDFEEDDFEENERSVRNHRIVFTTTAFVLFLAILFSYALYSYHVSTVAYQIEKAKEYAASENYKQAVAYLETAYEKDPSQADILFLEADYYYLMSDQESALRVLRQVIERDVYSLEHVEEAYDKMITIYTQQERYEDINALLLACDDSVIVNRYQGYLAKEPEFSYVEGDYAEVIPLKLSSNTSGTIYYTLDGSLPDETSDIYTAPLFLESGDYTVNAVFINDYGIRSEVVSKSYHISLEIPNAPEVTLYSGEYTEPMMISVEGQEGCSIYYTTGGAEPTKDSVPYTGPIPMPLGTTSFKFVNISEEGVSSDVTMRTYTLTLQGTISTEDAVNRLIARLVETGYLLDESGRVEQLSVTYCYRFSSVLKIGEDTYFTINEYYDDGTGALSRTDKVFLVQVYTGEAARLGYDEEGAFRAVLI